MTDFEGQHAWITGGGSGIGLATARRFVDAGAKVTIVGRDAEKLAKSAEHLGSAASWQSVDVGDEAGVRDAVAEANARAPVTIAVANAGTGDAAPFFDLMAELVCRDDQSEMHAYKLQQAAYEEYYATREPLRRVHMVAAAKHMAGIAQLRPQTVYPQTLALAGVAAH